MPTPPPSVASFVPLPFCVRVVFMAFASRHRRCLFRPPGNATQQNTSEGEREREERVIRPCTLHSIRRCWRRQRMPSARKWRSRGGSSGGGCNHHHQARQNGSGMTNARIVRKTINQQGSGRRRKARILTCLTHVPPSLPPSITRLGLQVA